MLSFAPMSVWKSLLATAIHSPSPHNVQPWRVRLINDSEADLLIDSARTLPKEDITGSFIILTMGLFIEALDLVAAHQGFRVEHSLYHEASWYAIEILKAKVQTFLPFARLRLTPATGVSSDFDPALFMKRRTSRISLLPKAVPEGAFEKFQTLAHEWDHRYEEIADRNTIERILQKNTEALFEDLNNSDYHDEIVQWFRFSDKASQLTRDGLDYRCMNTAPSAYWLTARFPWLLELPFARSAFKRRYRSQLGEIPTIGLLAGKFWQAQSAFKAGRFLMRFWLETAKLDLYIHPYGNMVTNQRAAKWLRDETGVADIWLVFKIGYSKEPPKSYRRSVEEILID